MPANLSRKSYTKPSMTSHLLRPESMIAASGTSGTGGNIPFGAPDFRGFNTFSASSMNGLNPFFFGTDELGK